MNPQPFSGFEIKVIDLKNVYEVGMYMPGKRSCPRIDLV